MLLAGLCDLLTSSNNPAATRLMYYLNNMLDRPNTDLTVYILKHVGRQKVAAKTIVAFWKGRFSGL